MSVEATAAAAARVGDDDVQNYLQLKFGDGSELRARLLSRVDSDAAHDRIAISDIGAPSPAYFTNEMSSWFLDNVAFARGQALERVRTLFISDRHHNGSPGCLLEAERETIDDHYTNECRTARQQVRQRRHADLENIAELERDISQCQEEFAALRDRLGREPVIPNSFLYIGAMFVVGIAEAFINYDSFRALSWATPFIATGTTFAIGMSIALAAHMHGTLLKRFRSYFDDDVDLNQRWVAARMFGIGTTALLIALAAVAYARNVYFVQTALGDAAFGAAGGGQRLWIVGGSLLGNMLVYLIGAILAFLMHDEVARYAELRRMLDKKKRLRSKLVTSIDGEISQKLRAAATRRQKAHEQLQHRDGAQRAAPNYVANRKLFEAIVNQDSRALGALQAYRSQLCQRKKDAGEVFSRVNEDDKDRIETIDAAGYQQLALALKYR